MPVQQGVDVMDLHRSVATMMRGHARGSAAAQGAHRPERFRGFSSRLDLSAPHP
jgi:hypothetical protein